MLAAAQAVAEDDVEGQRLLSTYLERYLDGDGRAFGDYERAVALSHGERHSRISSFDCCTTPDVVLDAADDRVCRSCGACAVIGPTSVAARQHAVWDLTRTNVTYERRNHWNEFMNCVLCRETTTIPARVLRCVREAQPRTIADVYVALRQGGFQKYYKNVYLLFRHATGRTLVHLDDEQEEQLRALFRAAEQAWVRSHPPAQDRRRNFLRNTFLLGMFARILAQQCPWDGTQWIALAQLMLPHVPRTATAAQRIWQTIATSCGWTMAPNI